MLNTRASRIRPLAAVLAVLALAALVTTHQVPASARALKVVPGRATDTPSFVTGIAATPRRGRPADIALGHLAAHPGRYGIANVHANLHAIRTHEAGRLVTVRLAQTHRGVPVFGGTYLVHMVESPKGLSVEATGGDHFTELSVDVQPDLSASAARRLAVLRSRPMNVSDVEDHGLVVLPQSQGVLAYRFTLSGSQLGRPAKKDVFISARTGLPVLSYSRLMHNHGATVGSGSLSTDPNGNVPLDVFHNSSSIYQMRNASRPDGQVFTHDANGRTTYDFRLTPLASSAASTFDAAHTTSGATDAHYWAEKVYQWYRASSYVEGMAPGVNRNSIDDQGMAIHSTVDALDPSTGQPMFNAFWDGQQMVYGNPGASEGVRPFSAALDVVGHELTHGVTEFSVDGVGLIPVNQSGAMNEAYSDYFGEAIENTVLEGNDMNAQGAGEIGEDLCLVPNPPQMECPIRDISDPNAAAGPANTSEYRYLLLDFDYGGIHINSTIYGAALWDIREALWAMGQNPVEKAANAAFADRIIYRALVAHTTPLQDFVAGRNAVVQAATLLSATPEQLDAINAAFDGRGIVSGWSTPPTATRGRTLDTNVIPIGFFVAPPRAWGERYIVGDYPNKRNIYGPLPLFVGRTGCGTCPRIRVDEAGRPGTASDEAPAIAGDRAVWTHITTSFTIDVHTRRLGRTVGTVAGGSAIDWFPAIAKDGSRGTLIAWESIACSTCDTDIRARYLGKPVRTVFSDVGGEQLYVSVAGPWIAWWDLGQNFSGNGKIGIYNMVTKKRRFLTAPPSALMGPPTVNRKYVFWYQDDDFFTPGYTPEGKIMRSPLSGTTRKVLVPTTDPTAPVWDAWGNLPFIAANERHLAYTDERNMPGSVDPSIPSAIAGRDVWTMTVDGASRRRVTAARGDQAYPAMAARNIVLWFDAHRAVTDLRAAP